MKKKILYLFPPTVLVLGILSTCLGSPTYLAQYNATYGTTASCSLCHTTAPALNATGNAFKASGHNVASIAPASSGTTKPATGGGTATTTPPASPRGKTGSTVGQVPSTTAQTNTAASSPKPKKTTPAAKDKNTVVKAQKNSVSRGSAKIRTNTSGTSLDMSVWTGKWFEINVQNKGYYMGSAGLSNNRETLVRYFNISSWDPANKILQGTVYEQVAEKGNWSSGPLSLYYISGSNLDFRFWSQATGDSTYGFAGRVQGQEAGGVLQSAQLTTSGGYHLQSGDSGSGGHWAGWLAVTGNLIPDPGIPITPTP